jgi:flagellar hook-associated protein 2
LAGDAGVRNLINNIHADLSKPVAGASSAFNSLAMIGVSIDQSGVMVLDNTKLSNALSQDPNTVATLFSSTQDGIVTRLNYKVDPYLSSGVNIINSGQSSLERQMKSLENKRGDVKHRMDGLEQLLLKQYLVMDQLVSKYKSIGPMVTNAFRAFEKHDD